MVGKLRIAGGGEASRNVPWDWKTLGGGGEGKLGTIKAVRALAVPKRWKRIKQSELQRALDLPDRFRHDFTSLLMVTVTTTNCYYLQYCC